MAVFKEFYTCCTPIFRNSTDLAVSVKYIAADVCTHSLYVQYDYIVLYSHYTVAVWPPYIQWVQTSVAVYLTLTVVRTVCYFWILAYSTCNSCTAATLLLYPVLNNESTVKCCSIVHTVRRIVGSIVSDVLSKICVTCWQNCLFWDLSTYSVPQVSVLRPFLFRVRW